MRRIILFVLLISVCAIAYASDISLEPLMNRVFDSTDSTIKATISGNATMTNVSSDTVSVDSVFVMPYTVVSPDNSIAGTEGQLLSDTNTRTLWINVDGSTAWDGIVFDQ